MNLEHDSNLYPVDEIELDDSVSIDDFIKELEAKEMDLHITSDLEMEIEEVKFDIPNVEDIVEPSPNKPSTPAQAMPNSTSESNLKQSAFSDLEAELSKLRAEKSEMQESFRRRQTDFENFRKRTDRERSEIFRSVISNLAVKILPVVDNLNRALDSSVENEKTVDFQHFVDGIRLVNHQLSEVLEEMGIQPIIAVGQTFDPHFHEAVATVPSDELPPNTVVEELLRGYRIDGKVIRASMVKVSS